MSQDTKELRRVLAPNPSPLTGQGTNTFLIGVRDVAVIDPGPDDAGHLQAIVDAAGGKVSHILVTHAHRDHTAGVAALARMTGAPVYAFGDALSGRSASMKKLSGLPSLGGGEGLDMTFRPDHLLADNDVLETDEWQIRALHTPGHSGGHLSFQWQDMILTGDIVMGWSSTIISPPDGDLADYFASLDRLKLVGSSLLLPAHGDAVTDPAGRIAELVSHRQMRTDQILIALQSGPANAADLARKIYDIPPQLLPAAARNVLAHLIALTDQGLVRPQQEISADAVFELL